MEKGKNKTRVFTGFPALRESLLARLITPKVEYSIQRDSHGYYFLQQQDITDRNF